MCFLLSLPHCILPNRKKNQYQYKLDGFNSDWVTTTFDNRRATYTNLPAGDYTFRVKASNHQGVWNDKDKTIKLTMKQSN